MTMNTSSEVQDNGFVQFVFENANHNTRTVDGNGIFYVMGGIQCVTPSSAVRTSSCILRPKIIRTEKVVGKIGFIPIFTHNEPKNHELNRLVMEDVLYLKLQPMDTKIGTTYHRIWMAGPRSSEEPHKGWSGFMEIGAGKRCYDKSAVIPSSIFNPNLNLTPVFVSRLKNAGSGNKGELRYLICRFLLKSLI
ncbi:hypothetical protein AVEN_143357-1 [Araneus ventricosus]|uniref:Uncharacterized protein n=1 Tax=Araneus ventricosus TaxID=182803 RepID=A0A4Y2ADW8_ARAVE|nr:hypothetical protein AVEN_143357-1 [Araneus ventricosus]